MFVEAIQPFVMRFHADGDDLSTVRWCYKATSLGGKFGSVGFHASSQLAQVI